jgi:hypothetical protein
MYLESKDCPGIALLWLFRGETKNVIFTPGIVLVED